MPFSRATRRIAAWLAMLAVLLGALAPGVAQALVAAQGGSGWMQVCSASGMVWVQSDAVDDPAAGKPLTDASRHCPWCSPQGAAGLPPEPSPVVGRTPAFEAPRAHVRSATPALPWPAAKSRAPPPA